ncbi:Ribokinase-like protein [Ostreococcus tauri]|uniref:Ribokinase-like protein n=1 Tax=Ostreococcus tauri TaxID=70448 RepID=A0A1Y5IJA0_OSTTA|nr:Ribokinase-like protein [Ostreococcus tauri]
MIASRATSTVVDATTRSNAQRVRSGSLACARSRTRARSRASTSRLATRWGDECDVVALGNLCVDVLLPPGPIPEVGSLKTSKTLNELAKTAPARESWELGGNCNFLIAAARLGLRATCAGHVGNDQYGQFLIDELTMEGVDVVELVPDDDTGVKVSALAETLICFVLSDGDGGHAFCSRYDLGPWPLMRDVGDVSNDAREALRSCKAVFVNGFVFDELKPQAVAQALKLAKSNGAGVFFDPGPRSFTFVDDTNPARMEALEVALTSANVVLATEEELAALTGLDVGSSPEAYASAVFDYPNSAAEWVVVKLGPRGAMVITRDGKSSRVGCPKVKVGDTVGCGDSSAGAYVLGYLRMQSDDSLDLSEALATTATLATHVGSATAMNVGAGRNVAKAETVIELLDMAANGKTDGVDANVAQRARSMLRTSIASARERDDADASPTQV